MKLNTKIITFIFCIGFIHCIHAQFGTKVGLAANLLIPTSDFTEIANIGYGGTGYIIANASPRFSFTASFGYFIFGKEQKDTNGQQTEYSVKAIPFLLGFRYYFGSLRGPLPYVGGLAGIYSMIIKVNGTGTPAIPIEGTERRGRISFGPVAGIEFRKLDFSAYYMFIPDKFGDANINYNHLGLQVGINF